MTAVTGIRRGGVPWRWGGAVEERFEVESKIEPAEGQPHWLIPAVAITTAVLAMLAAYASYAGGKAVHDSLASLTEAAVLQSQASDQWSFYQAEGIKRHVFEVQRDALRLGGASAGAALAARYDREAARYAAAQRKISKDAQALEQRRDDARHIAERYDSLHERLGSAVAFFQAGIVLCSVAAIIRRTPLWYGGIVAGAAGAVLLLQAVLPSLQSARAG
ncbi:MAG TPA: DUF4337 domain-containing protein [bacterium]|nr:DUF4337 domain-containing protein [bacterium]